MKQKKTFTAYFMVHGAVIRSDLCGADHIVCADQFWPGAV